MPTLGGWAAVNNSYCKSQKPNSVHLDVAFSSYCKGLLTVLQHVMHVSNTITSF